jgi:hypothetical protein
VAAVDHDAGQPTLSTVVLLAERAAVLVQQLGGEFVDLAAVEVGRVLRLLEEEGRRVLQLFHQFKI